MVAGLRLLPLTAQAVHLCVDMCKVKLEMKKNLSTIIAAAIVTEAIPKRTDANAILDGRVTGRSGACWFETLQYDGLGVPYGPYCH